MATPMATSSPRPLTARPSASIRPPPLAARPVTIQSGASMGSHASIAPQLQPSTGDSTQASTSKPPASTVDLAPRAGPSKPALAIAPSTSTPGVAATTALRVAPSSSKASASAIAPTASIAIKAGSPPAQSASADRKNAGGSSIQPSKEWVLPARAKPGRKPSETEPPTKRKAQNRASQRAFRERKQMYLADLEAKVAAYEKEEIDRSVEIQKAAKRLKDENDALKRENASLKKKCGQLELLVASFRAAGDRAVAPLPSSSRSAGPGCKAPAHEVRSNLVPRKGVLATATGGGRSTVGAAKGGVRFADELVDVKPPLRSTTVASSLGATVALATPPHTSTSSRTIQQSTPSSALPIMVRRPTAAASTSSSSTPLWSVKLPTATIPPCPSSSKERLILSPPLMGKDHAIPIEGGCGFCSEEMPCVCADDFLNLDHNSEKDESPRSDRIAKPPRPSTALGSSSGGSSPDDAASAVPLLRGRRDATMPPVEQAPSMCIDSLTNAAAPGLRGAGRKRLWYTVPPADEAPTVCPTPTSRPAVAAATAGASTRGPPKKKLWYTVPASDEQSFNSRVSPSLDGSAESYEPVCTGDPSSCGACSADPGLAVFCVAVTNSVRGTTTTFTSWDAGNAIPLSSRARSNSTATRPHPSAQRPTLSRFSTTGHLSAYSGASTSTDPRHLASPIAPSYTGISPHHQTETITSAWRQIRSHPRFNQWQGGLDLLAEVVSRRSGSIHSPLLGEQQRARAVSVEIEPVKRTAMANVESHDRATRIDGAAPRLVHTESDSTLVTAMCIKREREDVDMDISPVPADETAGAAATARESKRRRILVEREAVQEALALLDRGTAQFPILTSALPASAPALQRRDSISSTRTAGGQQVYATSDLSASYHEHDDKDGPCPCPWWRPTSTRESGMNGSRRG